MNEWGKTQGEKMYEALIRQAFWDMWLYRIKWLLCILIVAATLKYLFS